MKHRSLYALASLPLLMTISAPAFAADVPDDNPTTITAQKPVTQKPTPDPSMDEMRDDYQKQVDKVKDTAEQQGTMKYQLTKLKPKPQPRPAKSDEKPQAQTSKQKDSSSQQSSTAQAGTTKAPKKQARQGTKARGFSEPHATRSGGPQGTCQASMYGYKDGTAGGPTASGERFNPEDFTAAHKSFKFGTKVKVTNKNTGKSVVVRITDRGPYVGGRCLDLSTAAMKKVGGFNSGVIPVKWQIVG